MFSLHKWYLDVVTGRGDAAILYAAHLQWGTFRIGYASTLEDTANGTHRESSTVRRVDAPRCDQDTLAWHNGALNVQGQWHRDAPSIEHTVASTSEGVARWTCHMPRARATVRIGDITYEGLGYAEHLTLTIPPWKLPFDTLRWGRHASDRHSLVWIDWRGPEHRSWVWLDGLEQREAMVTDSGVSGLSGGGELRVAEGRSLVNREVLATLTGLMPGLTRRLPGRLAVMREHKRLERSSIVNASERRDDGWTLREVVTW